MRMHNSCMLRIAAALAAILVLGSRAPLATGGADGQAGPRSRFAVGESRMKQRAREINV